MPNRRNKKKQTHRLWLPLVILILLVAAGGTLLALHNTNKSKPAVAKISVKPTNTVNYSPPTTQDKAEVNQNKQQIVASTKNTDSSSSTSSSSQSSSNNISVTLIGYTNASSNQPLEVRTLVEGATSGTCTLSFSQGSQSFSENFSIIFQATSATCQDASVPASDFPTSGDWMMSIVAKSGSDVSPAVNQAVEVTTK